MGQETQKAGGSKVEVRPPKFLESRRSRTIWKYLIDALDQAKMDYQSALMSLALLADKIDSWRDHADAVHVAGFRYDEDANGGSLESDESRAERRARVEVLRDLDQTGLTVLSVAQIRVIDRLSRQDDLFSPFELIGQLDQSSANLMPLPPPWTMRPKEKKIWKELLPLLEPSGFDFSTAGISLGLLCAAIADWQDCKDWISENKGKVFAEAKESGRTYEVSASYNRAKIAKQIRDLLKKNGMTVYSCAKNKAISKGKIVSPELAEILGFIGDRPD
ncbi:P27 family phage terminase small subunit [Chitinibacter fontanus]|uniref:P27 family phage terminase small subunit n=1 Tax=Chitinibacter fontanus TaxID=1737446 RepID=A0A7D5ZCR0_9NEIS|nr:P27 family phage terminase small subunit [Chitinibacter fontanus]QLI80804.1 P27 family phage terminase small subunit [Chitinibacter fontanus]